MLIMVMGLSVLLFSLNSLFFVVLSFSPTCGAAVILFLFVFNVGAFVFYGILFYFFVFL